MSEIIWNPLAWWCVLLIVQLYTPCWFGATYCLNFSSFFGRAWSTRFCLRLLYNCLHAVDSIANVCCEAEDQKAYSNDNRNVANRAKLNGGADHRVLLVGDVIFIRVTALLSREDGDTERSDSGGEEDESEHLKPLSLVVGLADSSTIHVMAISMQLLV